MTTRALLCLALAFAASGCFTVDYRLPTHSYFGRLPAQPGEKPRDFDREAMKNWYLAGLFSWSKFSTDDLIAPDARVRRIESLELESRFSKLDTLIWVIPGQVYGYYFWAPRTLRIRGREIRAE
jgi:hypothetical protein